MTRRSSTAAFLLTTLFTLALGAVPQPARSASYIVESCNRYTQDIRSFGNDWGSSGYGTGTGGAVNHCPEGIVFDYDGPAPDGAIWDAFFLPLAASKLLSAQFDYWGGDESGAYRYSVRACKEIECPIVTELDPGGSEDAPHKAQFGLAPVETSEIAIFAECIAVICPDPPPFVSRNFWFEYEDNELPSVEDLQTTPAGALDSDPPVWLNGGNLKVAFTAKDADSGVMLAAIGVKRPDTGKLFTDCLPGDSSSACPRSMDVESDLDLDGLEDGEHAVRIIVHDATLVHPYALDLPLHIDSTPPDEPTDVAISTNVTKWGWTPEPFAGLSHGDPLESANNTAYSGWKSAVFDLREGPNAIAALTSESEDATATGEFAFPHEGAWDIGVRYKDGAGNAGNRAHRFVGFDTDRPEPPVFDSIGWIRLGDLYSGVTQEWLPPSPDPNLESGICGYAFAVDEDAASIPDAEASVIAPTTSAPIPTSLGEGRHFAHLRSIACNGLASETVTGQVNVDGTAPTASVVGLGSGGWITSPPNVSIFANDSGSGVDGIEYGFEGDANLQEHAGSIAPVSVPQGESELSFRAVDAVGNVGELQTRKIKADWTGPTVSFETASGGGQNEVSAVVRDDGSGLATADMQIRRTDTGAGAFESSWRSLGGDVSAAPEGRHELTITRGVPDGDLPAGTYEVRVSARDLAGNWSDPVHTEPMTLPLRGGTTLSAAIAKVGVKSKVNWSGARQERLLRFGTRSALVGTLLDASGLPVANAKLSIAELPRYGVEDSLKPATTDANGEFVVMLPAKGVTRTFTVHYDGSDRLQPATETATIRVRAALTISIKPRRVRAGRPFVISGKLLSGAIGAPEGGKIVSIQYLRRRTPITVFEKRVDAKGRFSVRYSDGLTTDVPKTIYFHAMAQDDGNWPFVKGSSEWAKLRLLPAGP